jgi:hypothetical protein
MMLDDARRCAPTCRTYYKGQARRRRLAVRLGALRTRRDRRSGGQVVG